MGGNLAALVLALGVSLGAAEAILRAFVTRPLPRIQPEVRYLPHAERRFTLAPAQRAFTYGAAVTIDERGFRTNGTHPTDRSSLSILALGDSFTFGMGVRDDETWPARLEGLLRQNGQPSVRVTNAGTISYGVFQELDLLQSAGLAMRPHVILHALYWNDFMNPGPPPPGEPAVVTSEGYLEWDSVAEDRSWLSTALSAVTSRSALLFAMKQTARQLLTDGSRSDASYGTAYAAFLERGLTDDQWKPIDQFYTELLSLMHAHQMKTFVVIMPVNDVVMKSGAESHPYPVAARHRLEMLGIPYLDAFTLWSKAGHGGRHFLPQGSDAHLNAEGYRIIAEAMVAELSRAGVLGQTGAH